MKYMTAASPVVPQTVKRQVGRYRDDAAKLHIKGRQAR
jgi:hypothetical protein